MTGGAVTYAIHAGAVAVASTPSKLCHITLRAEGLPGGIRRALVRAEDEFKAAYADRMAGRPLSAASTAQLLAFRYAY